MADGLLVKVRQGSRTSGFAAARALGPFDPILELPPGHGQAMGLAPDEGAAWVLLSPDDNPWSRAYSLLGGGFGAAEAGVLAVEPDVGFQLQPPRKRAGTGDRYPDPRLPPGWHLEDAFSGLRTARERVRAEARARAGGVRIAHLDTGWSPGHPAAPAHVWDAESLDFTSGRARPGALDERTPSAFIFQRGHGTGTIGILAGQDPGGAGSGELGGAPDAQILPIRVANSVVLLKASGATAGFDHAIRRGAHVVSMSLGGLPSQALAEAVNLAYGRGIVVVAAAGNYFGGLPSPESIVYPARMRRVIAATGVMSDGRAYTGLAEPLMQGCVGPRSKMETALAAWTPHIPWAQLGGEVAPDGGGTSAATPQIAAAAALWIALHHDLWAAQAGWRRGELVRAALFRSARKRTAALDEDAVKALLGQGALDAAAALDERPDPATLAPQPEATARLAWLKLLTGQGVGIAAAAAAPRARLMELEALHAMQRNPALQRIVADPDAGDPGEKPRRAFLEALREAPELSSTLGNAIEAALSGRAAPRAMPAAAAVRAAPADRAASRHRPPAPERRRLRIFALDPSLGAALATVDANIATVDVPYETGADARTSILAPGPVGEYLEVVDVDPASDRFYPPVDLDDPHVLATDGLAPSEGNPQFHQQMVYAVAMRTIESFERALGRPAIWAPRRRPGADYAYEFVQRLRIYPHALRGRNAYYSPDKVALLFGYFASEAERGAATPPGSLVFSCLSADIVAHEMTHALLDGYTRSFREASNPDVGAFHEAFADIVALMQHFQIKDLVRREIAGARADLGAAALLAGLARQFGEGARSGGPLRNYERSAAAPAYRTTFEVHARGSILVRAVYLAFVAIFERRAADLLRLATGGSGVLGPGAVHPDLVERLTYEACAAAGQVLRMAIRALDFAPHADVTFGDYLRGLITADLELIEDDPLRYRTAFLESFRTLDLLPDGLRTVSVETLRWPTFAQRLRTLELDAALGGGGDAPAWLKPMVDELGIPWRHSPERWEIWRDIEERGRAVGRHLRTLFREQPAWMRALGLAPGLPRYAKDGSVEAQAAEGTTFQVRTVRGAQRPRPDGRIRETIVIGIHQRRPVAFDGADLTRGFFWFRGAVTLVIEPATSRTASPRLLYVIARDVIDRGREARERDWRTGQASARAMYFGPTAGAALDWSAREPFAALHAEEG